MKKFVLEEEKVVVFQGDWPSVMGIPHIMKGYPGYTHRIISFEEFEEKYGKKKSI